MSGRSNIERAAGRGPLAGRADLDLARGVTDPEPILEHLLRAEQEFVARMPLRHDQVAGQRRIGRAHCPNMQVVHALDARKVPQGIPDLPQRDASRHAVERQAQGLGGEDPTFPRRLRPRSQG